MEPITTGILTTDSEPQSQPDQDSAIPSDQKSLTLHQHTYNWDQAIERLTLILDVADMMSDPYFQASDWLEGIDSNDMVDVEKKALIDFLYEGQDTLIFSNCVYTLPSARDTVQCLIAIELSEDAKDPQAWRGSAQQIRLLGLLDGLNTWLASHSQKESTTDDTQPVLPIDEDRTDFVAASGDLSVKTSRTNLDSWKDKYPKGKLVEAFFAPSGSTKSGNIAGRLYGIRSPLATILASESPDVGFLGFASMHAGAFRGSVVAADSFEVTVYRLDGDRLAISPVDQKDDDPWARWTLWGKDKGSVTPLNGEQSLVVNAAGFSSYETKVRSLSDARRHIRNDGKWAEQANEDALIRTVLESQALMNGFTMFKNTSCSSSFIAFTDFVLGQALKESSVPWLKDFLNAFLDNKISPTLSSQGVTVKSIADHRATIVKNYAGVDLSTFKGAERNFVRTFLAAL